jgi:predicted aspartyl protease
MPTIRRLLGAIILAGTSVVVSAICHADVAVLPFVEGSGTWPIVKLQIGPGISGNFLLDTGASSCLITDGFAARCSLTVNPLTDDLKQAMARIPCAGYADTQIGDLRPLNRDVRFMVVPSSYIPRLGVPIDGVIGNDLLSRAPAMYDFELRKIFLWDKPGVAKHTLMALGMSGQGVCKLALLRSDNGNYGIEARINDTLTLRMLVDTGAEVTIIPEEDAKRLHLKPYRDGVRVGSPEGAERGDEYLLDKIAFGPAEVYKLPAFAMPARSTFPSDRVIGRSVLRYFRILLDPQAAEVLMKFQANPPTHSESNPESSREASAPRHAANGRVYAGP